MLCTRGKHSHAFTAHPRRVCHVFLVAALDNHAVCQPHCPSDLEVAVRSVGLCCSFVGGTQKVLIVQRQVTGLVHSECALPFSRVRSCHPRQEISYNLPQTKREPSEHRRPQQTHRPSRRPCSSRHIQIQRAPPAHRQLQWPHCHSNLPGIRTSRRS